MRWGWLGGWVIWKEKEEEEEWVGGWVGGWNVLGAVKGKDDDVSLGRERRAGGEGGLGVVGDPPEDL